MIGDEDSTLHFLADDGLMGGTGQSLAQPLRMLDPMSGMRDGQWKEFIQGLAPIDQDRVRRAYLHYVMIVDRVNKRPVTVEALAEREKGRNQEGWPGIAGGNGQRQPITLGARAFTTITVPSGAKFMGILLGGAKSLTLKGVTGDTGIPLTPSSNLLEVDALLPVAGVSSFGIANDKASAQPIEVLRL